MTSFIKSLSSIKGVNRVKFLVDNKKASTFFNGIDVSKSIKYEFKNKVYLGFNSYKKYYLVDCNVEEINDKMSIYEKIEKISYELKNKNVEGLFNAIPKDVDILNYTLNKDILSLNFNNEFLNSFNNNINLQKLMIDAIVFSFTSLDGINYIEIKVNGNSLENFAGINLSQPLKRPLYINPEYE